MKSVLETITDGAGYLAKRGVESPRLNMEHLLAKVLGVKRMQLYLWFDRPLEEKELAPLRVLTKRRGNREPLQHILGTVEFMGHTFHCDARALIPRVETEELVEKIQLTYKTQTPPLTFADVGTGSGVIGLSLLLAWPESHATLVDISTAALELCVQNAQSHEIDASRYRTVASDLLPTLPEQRYDLIVANLPYIPQAEMADLSAEVQHDPPLALVGGATGCEIMQRLIASLPRHLNSGGFVALEHHPGQGELLVAALEAVGCVQAKSHQDLQGRERFTFARYA
jgi:release factor glutamine methyltransferase